ncbi:MAG: hypothetical protein JWR67_981 [Mucilaginibacter sp.]|nr:hypothetical protein [Mucilaginibacter sp.]
MNYLLKISFLIVSICVITIGAKAQIGYNFSQYDVGIAAGINRVYGDAETFTNTPSAHFNFNYNATPFVNYVFEIQTGQLKGGNSLTTVSGRQFVNNFTSVMLRGQVQAGEIIDYSQSHIANAFKNLYLSTGIGFVVNHLTKVNRNSILLPGFYTPGMNNSNEILIPARIGYEFKVFNEYNESNFKIDIGYQYNFILGDGLDGYTVGNKNDGYSQFTLGIKFAIGSAITSYRKQIFY